MNMSMLAELIKKGIIVRNNVSRDHVPEGVVLPLITYSFLDYQEFEIWKNKCLRFLSNEFKGDRCIADFEYIIKEMDRMNYPESMDKLIGILEACVFVPRIERDKTTDKVNPIHTININNSQHQIQSQEIAINIFMEAIKDELTGKQLKEIKEMCENENSSPETKSKILDKLKSFGGDILSNIVANIITNPSIWGQL